MRISIARFASISGQGPAKKPLVPPSKTPPKPISQATASSSPLPGPIRRSVAALPSQSKPAVSSVSEAAKSQSAKTLADSYKSLSPNTRILFGVALGVVGIAGLYWDRWVAPEEAREGDKPLIAVRVVDRE